MSAEKELPDPFKRSSAASTAPNLVSLRSRRAAHPTSEVAL